MKTKFFPGWKMTHGQHASYFNLLTQVYTARGLRLPAEKEIMRKQIHLNAFGRTVSAKDIDHLTMFDQFKAACLAEIQPANLDAQLQITQQPLLRFMHSIRALADDAYILGLLRSPRFKKSSLADLEFMTEKERTDFRNTLAARATTHRREALAENPF